jgi:hypothetical protein
MLLHLGFEDAIAIALPFVDDDDNPVLLELTGELDLGELRFIELIPNQDMTSLEEANLILLSDSPAGEQNGEQSGKSKSAGDEQGVCTLHEREMIGICFSRWVLYKPRYYQLSNLKPSVGEFCFHPKAETLSREQGGVKLRLI